jgi:hypothetical protein
MAEESLSRKVSADELRTSPEQWMWLSWTDSFSMPRDVVEDIQLAGLRARFTAMVERLPVIARLAEMQNIDEVGGLDDGALLLLKHTAYKSYPTSLLEQGRFDRLTQWLDTLTTDDLSGVDASGVDLIDDWIDLLDRSTNVRLIHTSGTTGKLSFIPRNEREVPLMLRGWRQNFQGFGEEPNAADVEWLTRVPIIINNYRHGAQGHHRYLNGFVKYWHDGNEDMVLARSQGRLSADLMSLSGRLNVAAQRGNAGRLNLSPKLLERRDEFLRLQEDGPQQAQDFLDALAARLGGQRIMMMGNYTAQYPWAQAAIDRGLSHVFAPDSLVHTAGGLKGHVLPPNYREVYGQLVGVSHIYESFGMTEMISMLPKCPSGMHHISPCYIPYLVDPQSGDVLPRRGIQTGRFGFFDLTATTYWGGFLSGDKVMVSWEGTCECGRIGPRIHPDIRRYSAEEGGDDKITCAGVPEAHDRAIEFIASLA